MCRDIMTPDPVTVDFKAPLAQAWSTMQRMQIKALPSLDLLPLFSAQGHHHLPVISEDKRLVGVLTQTDLVRALGCLIRE